MGQDTLKIRKADAQKAYGQADSKLKPVLETLLGKSNLVPAEITERVKSFEDACEILGIDPDDLLHAQHSDASGKHIEAVNAFVKLRVIAEVLNEGWTPDWGNSNQYKYWPWFTNSGSGFSFFRCVSDCDCSSVGSRLCFKSGKLAEYAGKQFCDLYNQMFS